MVIHSVPIRIPRIHIIRIHPLRNPDFAAAVRMRRIDAFLDGVEGGGPGEAVLIAFGGWGIDIDAEDGGFGDGDEIGLGEGVAAVGGGDGEGDGVGAGVFVVMGGVLDIGQRIVGGSVAEVPCPFRDFGGAGGGGIRKPDGEGAFAGGLVRGEGAVGPCAAAVRVRPRRAIRQQVNERDIIKIPL